MHSRTIAHVMCFAMFTFGAAGGPAWSFSSDGNLTASCQAGSCQPSLDAFAKSVPPGRQRDRILVDVAITLAKSAQGTEVSLQQCGATQSAILAISGKVSAAKTRRQLETLADSVCTGAVTASISVPTGSRGDRLASAGGGSDDGETGGGDTGGDCGGIRTGGTTAGAASGEQASRSSCTATCCRPSTPPATCSARAVNF